MAKKPKKIAKAEPTLMSITDPRIVLTYQNKRYSMTSDRPIWHNDAVVMENEGEAAQFIARQEGHNRETGGEEFRNFAIHLLAGGYEIKTIITTEKKAL